MSVCVQWGSTIINRCVQWADQGSNDCTQWADQGSNQCANWADQGSNQCSGWWKWFCLAWYWIANWVCQTWYWVANVVCIVVTWIAKIVCILTVIVTVPICLIFEYGVIPLVKGALFGLLAPFAAAIDAVCEKCNAYDWVKALFWSAGKIEFVKAEVSATEPGQFDYTFVCHCSKKKDVEVLVTAANEDEAAIKAKEACADACA